MGEVLTNWGEEYIIDLLVGTTVEIGIYNDGTDAATDTTDLPLSSEPSNGNYVRQSHTIQSGDVTTVGGNYAVEIAVTFDTTNTTGTVDSSFAVINFQADESADGAATDHLMATANLSQSRDLSQFETLDVTFTLSLD